MTPLVLRISRYLLNYTGFPDSQICLLQVGFFVVSIKNGMWTFLFYKSILLIGFIPSGERVEGGLGLQLDRAGLEQLH